MYTKQILDDIERLEKEGKQLQAQMLRESLQAYTEKRKHIEKEQGTKEELNRR